MKHLPLTTIAVILAFLFLPLPVRSIDSTGTSNVNSAKNFPNGESQLINNLKAGKAQTIVTYGTSLTSGGAWVQQLGQALEARWPGKTKVINSGAGGMWSTWGVENLDTRVLAKKPDTLFIEFGINDAYLDYKTTVISARDNL